LKDKKRIEEMKTTFYINQFAANINLLNAHSHCAMMGMELYSPFSQETDKELKGFLRQNIDSEDDCIVGITRVGTKDFWFSMSSGERIDIEKFQSNYEDYALYGDCMTFKDNSYQQINCNEKAKYFLCQQTEVIPLHLPKFTQTTEPFDRNQSTTSHRRHQKYSSRATTTRDFNATTESYMKPSVDSTIDKALFNATTTTASPNTTTESNSTVSYEDNYSSQYDETYP